MSKILITGGAGFIGSHTIDALLARGEEVICLDNFNDYYSPKRKEKNILHNLNKEGFSLEKTDISDFKKLSSIFKKYNVDKIIHLAARAGVRPSLENPFIYEETNIKGTLNLLELARQHKISKFIFGSSSSVYGRNKKVPFSESDRTDNAISPYAATKKAGEVLCHTYSYLYGIDTVCLRFFTVYGPRGRPDMAPYLFTKSISEGKPITMYGDGTSRRDYTYVGDIVTGILKSMDKGFKYEIFNLGNSRTVELRKLISVIESRLGKKAIIMKKDMPKEDVPITYADLSKSKKLLGYSPQTPIEEGMSAFINWYKDEGL